MRRKLLSVLDAIDFSQEVPEQLQLDFFERAQIEQVISNCEHVNEQGHTVCNVKVGVSTVLCSRACSVYCLFLLSFGLIYFYLFFFWNQLLHRVLVAEINALQGMAAIGQRPLLLEVSVSHAASAFNCFQHKRQLVDGACWGLAPKNYIVCHFKDVALSFL